MKKGETFRKKGYKYHVVRTFVDDGEKMCIVKYYGKHLQWWHYEIMTDEECESWKTKEHQKKTLKSDALQRQGGVAGLAGKTSIAD